MLFCIMLLLLLLVVEAKEWDLDDVWDGDIVGSILECVFSWWCNSQ